MEETLTWYHGTTKELFEEIKQEEALWGKRATEEYPNMSRCTYLAVKKENAVGVEDGKMVPPEVLLEVKYDPFINPKDNNYVDSSWQIRVYEPIPIKDVIKLDKPTT